MAEFPRRGEGERFQLGGSNAPLPPNVNLFIQGLLSCSEGFHMYVYACMHVLHCSCTCTYTFLCC